MAEIIDEYEAPLIFEIAKNMFPRSMDIGWSEETGLYSETKDGTRPLKIDWRNLGKYGMSTDNLSHIDYLLKDWDYCELIGGISGIADVFCDIVCNPNLGDKQKEYFENHSNLMDRFQNLFDIYVENGLIHENVRDKIQDKLNHYVGLVMHCYDDRLD